MALKICGLTKGSDLEACLRLGVEYVGFNFYPFSKRFISAEVARQLWLEAQKRVSGDPQSCSGALTTKPVAVIVDASIQEISTILGAFPELRVIQCHGSESPQAVSEIQGLIGDRDLWKAIGVTSADDVRSAGTYADASLILFDAKAKSADPSLKGGTGLTFDWSLLNLVPAGVVWGLAGGISPAVLPTRDDIHPTLYDVCSGVESRPGHKDHQLLRAMVDALACKRQD